MDSGRVSRFEHCVNTLCIEEEAEAEREREREVILFFIRRETLKIKIKNNLFSLYNVTNIIQIFIVLNVALRASERARERERERETCKKTIGILNTFCFLCIHLFQIYTGRVCVKSQSIRYLRLRDKESESERK
mgnify:CR=1 FL=1